MHYLTKKEYSDLARISRPTIDNWIQKGKLLVRPIEGGADAIMVEDTDYNKLKGNLV